jgi:methyl-accepting chemotaxis protein
LQHLSAARAHSAAPGRKTCSEKEKDMKNLTVAKRLALGFVMMMVLLLAVSLLGIGRLGELNASLDDIAKDKWKKVTLLQEGLAGVNEIGLGARDMTLAAAKDG